MKAAVILSFAAAALAAGFEKRACHADNCARQVTGTRPGLLPITSRQSDCSSFMTAVVIPDAT
jgi:serine protease inhibitor